MHGPCRLMRSPSRRPREVSERCGCIRQPLNSFGRILQMLEEVAGEEEEEKLSLD